MYNGSQLIPKIDIIMSIASCGVNIEVQRANQDIVEVLTDSCSVRKGYRVSPIDRRADRQTVWVNVVEVGGGGQMFRAPQDGDSASGRYDIVYRQPTPVLTADAAPDSATGKFTGRSSELMGSCSCSSGVFCVIRPHL
ncbi:hypothetical protein J6590_064881 [Homalodisca vitripennis]|nr:hypothetical protein J6590_064881 [Homalodisca vitripennis]